MKFLSWLVRIIAALIMLQTLNFKFSAAPESVYIFETLGMEPWGRIGSGVAELIAAVLLLIPRTVWMGAILGMGVMIGAIASHFTKLGIEVQNDGGVLFYMAITVFVCCLIALILDRIGMRQKPYDGPLPIPKNFQKILFPYGKRNNEFKVVGSLKCTCGSNNFEVLYVGDEENYSKDNFVKSIEIDGVHFHIVKSKCSKCEKNYALFDRHYNGWEGHLDNGSGGRKLPRPNTKKWECIKCNESIHKVNVTIHSRGKKDFIEEAQGDFDENEWIEAYNAIWFEIECIGCNLKNYSWTGGEV